MRAPVVADALANLRCGAHDRDAVIAHHDALLRVPGFPDAHEPDLLLLGVVQTTQALDLLAIAVTDLAAISERRIERLLNPDLSMGLPAFLTSRPGLESPLSKVVSSTVPEFRIRFLACSLVRNCKKRLGLMPTQRLNRR